ncbi:Zinc ion binding protein [Phytophthora palmivora]|uniref:Zinc ion binding protein n=1 Tax=Phytophthora palmivora TaxID=4796 RepID=A0A2P4YIS6_9STRA|nr:Zinc ion binding protein [Phytophthora palmivora]
MLLYSTEHDVSAVAAAEISVSHSVYKRRNRPKTQAICASYSAGTCQSSHCKRTRVLRHLYFTSGRHYWEVLVERMADPRGVIVGVTPSEAFETGDMDEAVGYAATGVILHSGEEVSSAQGYAVGDTVGVFLDMNTQQVAFFLNDEAQINEVENTRRVSWYSFRARTVFAACVGNGVVGANSRLETKEVENTRRVSWYSFRARTVFAAIGTSSNADKLIVVGAEAPDGYR